MNDPLGSEECSKGFNQWSGRTEAHVWAPPGRSGDRCQCGEMVLAPIGDSGDFTVARST